ncbi:MAG: hypothetical protein UY07_C0024G0003 [Parcubacteria group bacterium GW2011_GWA1_47_8]|nr:MAG: hypothetical protein UY07_C0024G0003 [Parcubacteria group bacterium GW2011_GWA1_47_8]KKW07111.1 MAG: hypothetical protein UY42_C0018G0003 [Parcubacteria group bacterium GW2011_GWA2_49_16]
MKKYHSVTLKLVTGGSIVLTAETQTSYRVSLVVISKTGDACPCEMGRVRSCELRSFLGLGIKKVIKTKMGEFTLETTDPLKAFLAQFEH